MLRAELLIHKGTAIRLYKELQVCLSVNLVTELCRRTRVGKQSGKLDLRVFFVWVKASEWGIGDGRMEG